jgi:hypothetical protein
MKKRQNRNGEKQKFAESAEQVREKIRRRAYEFFALRGKEDGSDLDDWLKAESEVTVRVNRQSAIDRH